jgi:hypothetical protein
MVQERDGSDMDSGCGNKDENKEGEMLERFATWC